MMEEKPEPEGLKATRSLKMLVEVIDRMMVMIEESASLYRGIVQGAIDDASEDSHVVSRHNAAVTGATMKFTGDVEKMRRVMVPMAAQIASDSGLTVEEKNIVQEQRETLSSLADKLATSMERKNSRKIPDGMIPVELDGPEGKELMDYLRRTGSMDAVKVMDPDTGEIITPSAGEPFGRDIEAD